MVWTAANGVRHTTKLSTRTSAFLAAFLLAVSSLATTVSPFIERAFAASPLNGDSASLTVDNDTYAKTVDTSGLSGVKLTFDYDASTLDTNNGTIVLNYSAGSASGSVAITGMTGVDPLESNSVTLNNVPVQTNLPVSISTDTSKFQGDDSIELSNITVSGTENQPVVGSTDPSDGETIKGTVQLDMTIDNYDVSKTAHVYVYPNGSDTSVFGSNMTNKGGNHWQDDEALDTTKLDNGSYEVKFVVPQSNGVNIEKTVTVNVDNSSALSVPTDATQTVVTKVTKLTNTKYPYYELSYANFNVDDATEILQQAGNKVIKLALVQNDNDDYVWIDGHKYGSDTVNVYYKVNGIWKVTNLVYDANGNLFKLNGNVVDGYKDTVPPQGSVTSIGGKVYSSNGTITKLTNGKLQVSGTVSDNLAMNRVGVQLVKPGVSGDIQYVYANENHMYGQTGQVKWTAEFNNSKVATLADGAYGINLYYVDKAGNVSTQKLTFTLDSTRPVVKFTQAPSSFVNGDFDVSATFTDVNGIDPSSLVLQAEDLGANARAAKCVGGHPAVTVDSSTQVTLSCTIDTSMLQEGYTKYVVWAWGKDVAGNSTSNVQSSTNQSQVPFIVDRTNPLVKVNIDRTTDPTTKRYLSSGDTAGPNQRPEIEAFDTNLTKITVFKADGTTEVTHWGEGNSTVEQGRTTYKGIGWLGAGTYVIRAYDSARNVSQDFTITIDRTAPQGTFTYSNDDGNQLTNGGVTVTLTATEAVQPVGDGWNPVAGTDNQFTKVFTDNGPISAVITDMAGNSATVTGAVKRIDRDKPTFLNVSDGDVISTNPFVIQLSDPQLTGKSYFGLVSRLDVNGTFVGLTEDPTTHVFSTTLSNDGSYKVTATDKAGNETTVNFVIDSIKPTITITNPSVDGVVVDNSSNVEVEADDTTALKSVVVHLTKPDGSYATACLWKTHSASGQQEKSISCPLADYTDEGTYNLKVAAVDQAGNTVYASRTFVLNNTVPAVVAGDFATWNNLVSGGFNAVNVGFSAKDFKSISGMTVSLLDKDGKVITTNTASQSFVYMINANPSLASSLSSPFVVNGTLNDTYCGGTACWSGDGHTWVAGSEAPVSALVTVAGTDARGDAVSGQVTLTPLSESTATFASLLPAKVATSQPDPIVVDDGSSLQGSQNSPATSFSRVTTPRFFAANNGATGQGFVAGGGAVLGDSTSTDPTNADNQGQVKADTTTNTDPVANTGDPLKSCTKFFGLCWYWWVPIAVVVLAVLYWLFKPRTDNRAA